MLPGVHATVHLALKHGRRYTENILKLPARNPSSQWSGHCVHYIHSLQDPDETQQTEVLVTTTVTVTISSLPTVSQ